MTRLLVFDSGIGGLSVTREIMRSLPAAEIVYVADDAGFPYGDWDEPALTEPEAAEPTMAQLVEEAIAHRDRGERALREGNLALYAEEMRKVGEVLEKMKTIKK